MESGDQKNLLSFSSYYWMGPTFQRNKETYKHTILHVGQDTSRLSRLSVNFKHDYRLQINTLIWL